MTDYTDPAEREALRTLADKTTPGPWFSEQASMGTWDVSRNFAPGSRHVESIVEALHEGDDAEFIAASREAVPALLDLIDLAASVHADTTARAEKAEAEAATHREVAESMTGMWQTEVAKVQRLRDGITALADNATARVPTTELRALLAPQVQDKPECACGTDATSLNPDEVVVHGPDECLIASAAQPEAGEDR